MSSAKPPSPSGPQPIIRLTGWKEIATHFGRGVRTVQRWEKAFGMPVHRIGSGRGEAIHAFVHELDAWLATATNSRDLRDQPDETEPAEDVRPVVPPADERPAGQAVASATGGPRRLGWWFAGAAAAMVIIGSLAFWLLANPPEPSTAKVDGDTLRVYDVDGRFLWQHRFAGRLPLDSLDAPDGGGRKVLFEDINGDNAREVLVFGPRSDAGWATELFCFDAKGKTLWTRLPRPTVRFGNRMYAPPWLGHRLFVTGPRRNRQLWAVWIHLESGFFPCLLEHLSAGKGEPLSAFWSAGYVEHVQAIDVQGRPSIVVGASNNDQKGASLAVFDAGAVQGSAPALDDDKRCYGCPAGTPRAFLVFPRLELSAIADQFPFVFQVRRAETAQLSVWVYQPAGGGLKGSISYQLDANLRPLSAEIGAEDRAVHDTLAATGRPDHHFGARDEAEAWPVLVYDGTRFVSVTGPTTR